MRGHPQPRHSSPLHPDRRGHLGRHLIAGVPSVVGATLLPCLGSHPSTRSRPWRRRRSGRRTSGSACSSRRRSASWPTSDRRRGARSSSCGSRRSCSSSARGPHPPRALYRSYLAQSDVFVGIYWQRYGWVAPDMEISGLEDEFVLSAGMPRLVYVKRPAPEMEPRLAEMLGRLEGEDSASYKPFRDAAELHDLLLDDLAVLADRAVRRRSRRHAESTPAADLEPAGPDLDVPRPARSLLDELDVAARATTSVRLVTLTGPGGTGKTRLAVEARPSAGRALRRRGLLRRPERRARAATRRSPAIARGAGHRAWATRGLAARRARAGDYATAHVLLVLDNFEQVDVGRPGVVELLRALPAAQGAGHEPRGASGRGERLFPVPPLSLPAPIRRRSAVEDVLRSEAGRLFCERAGRGGSGFTLTEAQRCRRRRDLPPTRRPAARPRAGRRAGEALRRR